MKTVLNFETYELTDAILDNIKPREFDVRPTTVTNLKSVNELRILGLGTRRPPYVTTDLVVGDGRHLVDAWKLETPRPNMIRVRMLPFAYEDLNPPERAQFTAWALKQNSPSREGYREFYTTEHVTLVIRGFLKDGFERTQIRELLRDVNSSQFNVAFRSADESYTQSVIYATQKRMREEDLTPKQAAKTLSSDALRQKFLKKVGGGSGPRPKPHSGAKSIIDKQAAIDKAYAAVGGYNDTLFTRLGEPGYSVAIVQKVLATHRQTLKQLVERFERGASVVEKAIAAQQASLTRNPNRT